MLSFVEPESAIVVVPCYNEAARLDMMAFDAFLAESEEISFLFVDDGSRDDTPHLLEWLRALYPSRVFVLRLEQNVGKAEAVRRGVQMALWRRPAMVGYWDADLATPLEAIPQFREILTARPGVRLVMGSRVSLLGRKIQRRWTRHILGRAFATAASFVLGLPVYDTQCGAKLLRVTTETSELFRKPFRTRWIFDVELLARLVALVRDSAGLAAADLIYECPLERWQDVGGSRLQSLDFLTAAIDLVAVSWRYRRAAQPRKPQTISTLPLPQRVAKVPRREAA